MEKSSIKSEKLKAQNILFSDAVKYAKDVLKDEEKRKEHKEKTKDKGLTVFNLLISEYLKKKKRRKK